MTRFEVPETQYTRSAGRSIAFQVCGQGALDLVFTPGSFNHVDVWWEHPVTASFLRSLATFSRLIMFDRRGTGASDPLPSDELPKWQDWLTDLRAVLAATGSERVAILASLDGGPTALAFAAEEPDRVSQLILHNTTACFRAAEGYPCGADAERTEAIIRTLASSWGTDAFSAANYPDRADDPDFLRWYSKYQRAAVGKGRVEAVARAWFDIDARELVERVRAPTLVIQRKQHRMIPETHGQWLAEHLHDANLVTLPGASALFGRDAPEVLDHVSRFLTGHPLAVPVAPEARAKPPEVRGYELVRLVGRGGMAEVWEARSVGTGDRFAIKLMRRAATPELCRRLLREAAATSAVRHPGVVSIREVTPSADGAPALVMELLEGETLASKLLRDGALALDQVASLVVSIASAVGTAHELGIVHRDLKPANVFLARSSGEAQVKVLDFGIAKVLGETHDTMRLTASGALLGTPSYMAPEQLLGEPFDHRADIWALGIMAFEMLTGVLPTRAANVGQILKLAMGTTAWDARRHVPDLPAVVSDLVARMLAREPDGRPADLREACDVFSRYSALQVPAFGAPLSRRAELPDARATPSAPRT